MYILMILFRKQIFFFMGGSKVRLGPIVYKSNGPYECWTFTKSRVLIRSNFYMDIETKKSSYLFSVTSPQKKTFPHIGTLYSYGSGL